MSTTYRPRVVLQIVLPLPTRSRSHSTISRTPRLIDLETHRFGRASGMYYASRVGVIIPKSRVSDSGAFRGGCPILSLGQNWVFVIQRRHTLKDQHDGHVYAVAPFVVVPLTGGVSIGGNTQMPQVRSPDVSRSPTKARGT